MTDPRDTNSTPASDGLPTESADESSRPLVGDQPGGDDAREEAFFARSDAWDGAPIPDDYVDPEFADLNAAPGLLQAILILLVMGFTLLLAWQYRGELTYAVSSGDAMEVGDVSDFSSESLQRTADLPDNRYVSLEGVGVERAVSGAHEYRRLQGSYIYVQLNQSVDEEAALNFGEASELRGARQVIGGRGRLIAARLVPAQLRAVFDYYSQHYGVRFCDIKTPAQIVRYRESEREAAIFQFRDDQGRDPTEAELRQEIGPDCHQAFLLQLDRAPADFRIYIALYAGFAIVLIVSMLLLARWVRRIRETSGSSAS